jgi:hypothetical protein
MFQNLCVLSSFIEKIVGIPTKMFLKHAFLRGFARETAEQSHFQGLIIFKFSPFEVDMLRDKLGINNQMKALLECLKNRQRGYQIKILNFSSFFPTITQSIQSVNPP